MTVAMPARYAEPPATHFAAALESRLRAGMTILDAGSGRAPAVSPAARAPGADYVGLDISAAELAAAPAGSYVRAVVADLTEPVPGLEESFDLVISWQVLEHVASTERALTTVRSYLRPGGTFVAMLSGRFSLNAVIGGLVPERAAGPMLRLATGRDPDTVFPTHYDRCTHAALTALLAPWSWARVQPLFQGGAYLTAFPPLLRGYLAYESWAERRGRRNLATHYLITATR